MLTTNSGRVFTLVKLPCHLLVIRAESNNRFIKVSFATLPGGLEGAIYIENILLVIQSQLQGFFEQVALMGKFDPLPCGWNGRQFHKEGVRDMKVIRYFL